jgi:conjugal transfer mating pair stabilization protein TraG
MSLLQIYTPQHGDFLKTALDAVVTLLSYSTFQSAKSILLTLAACMTAYQFIVGKKIEALMRYVLTSFFTLVCLIGVKVNVAIIDMQTAGGAGAALTVDHVPLGVALPAALISGLGYGITQLFSDVFHMPADLDYNKTGMIFGARTWLSSTQVSLSMSPELAADASAYIRQCIFAAKLLASHQISPQDLVKSTDLIKLYFENPSPIYRVILHDGSNLGCAEAAINLKKRFPAAVENELQHLSKVMKAGESATFKSGLEAAHTYYMSITANAADILTQNILINATREAAKDAFAFSGADAELMNYTNTTSMQKMHVAEANSFWLASYRLPYYMTVMWIITLCIFPLVFLISLLPTLQNVFTLYLQSQAYLWSWPPLFILIHFLVSLATAAQMNLFGGQTGGVSFSNIDAVASMHSNFAYTAGALAASVPFLAYYITKGLSSVLSTASQHFGGMVQSMSVSEAQAAAQGNVSMASYSGWNMNYDNHNAHKWDTNFHHAEGRATVQTANGAMLSETADGTRIGNVAPAISQGAVGVHASDRIADSLHQSANESFHKSSQLRTAADSHLQAGLNQLSSFAANDGNDYRSGEGVSNTVNDSYGSDLRKMKDAIKNYNEHHDVAGQVSLEAAAAYRLNSDKALWGKGLKWVTGTSIDVSGTARATGSTNHSAQWFNNSGHGKAFNEAFNHLVATAKNNHLDASDSHGLSKSGQIAANFSKGLSMLEQANHEYSHGEQLQQAASHTRDNAQTIDNNLNQAYHDWAVSRYGARGEQVMLQTDTQSIATQNKWVDEFLHSEVGKTALSSQVNAALARTGDDLRTDYDKDSAQLKTESIEKNYTHFKEKVDDESGRQGLVLMSDDKLSKADKILVHNRDVNVAKDAKKTQTIVDKNNDINLVKWED